MAGSERDVLALFKESWAREYVDDHASRYSVATMHARSSKSDGEDSLMGKTLKTPETIPHAVMLYEKAKEGRPHGETVLLFALGESLNGHPKLLHGGVIALLMDESCGYCNTLYSKHTNTFTARLSVNYRKPVPTPSVVLCRAWLTKVEGRKRYVSCTVEGPEGIVYAECDALFIEFKPGFKL